MAEVLHVACYSTADPLPVLRENISALEGFRSFVIVSSAQHLNRLDEVRDFLEESGKKAFVGGQVLGCVQDNALRFDADCVIYVGSGRFHPLGIAEKTRKPVYILNPISKVLDKISDAELKRLSGRKRAALAKALSSDVFGVLVSTKDGQTDLKRALEVKSLLEARSKTAYLIAAEELTPPNLLPFQVDCFVNTACVRLESDGFHRPVVDAKELADFFAG